MFRCSAPFITELQLISTKVNATLSLYFKVQSTEIFVENK